MKINYLNKFWKVGFVALITSVGFNLTSCSNKSDQKIAAVKTALIDFYSAKNKTIKDSNDNHIWGEHNKFFIYRNLVDADAPNVLYFNKYVNNNQLNLLDLSIYLEVRGSYYLTGNATKDYQNLTAKPFLLFNKMRKSYDQLITQIATIGYFNHGYFYQKFNIVLSGLDIFPNNSKVSYSDHKLATIEFYYDYRNDKFISNSSTFDKFNIKQIQLYETKNN